MTYECDFKEQGFEALWKVVLSSALITLNFTFYNSSNIKQSIVSALVASLIGVFIWAMYIFASEYEYILNDHYDKIKIGAAIIGGVIGFLIGYSASGIGAGVLFGLGLAAIFPFLSVILGFFLVMPFGFIGLALEASAIPLIPITIFGFIVQSLWGVKF